ncbi:hypothetical protein NMY22_g15354 [Coprinellus aureogranulatus]|nr:hypothetical protein NMY22_g15354 [Coprinellus aureogranulatus]
MVRGVILSEEGLGDGVLVELVQKQKGRDEVRKLVREGPDEDHGGELLVQGGQVEVLGAQRLTELHSLVNPVDERLKGLVLLLPDSQEVVVGVEAAPSLLLTVGGLQHAPHSAGIVLAAIHKGLLVLLQHQPDPACCLVTLRIPGILQLLSRASRKQILINFGSGVIPPTSQADVMSSVNATFRSHNRSIRMHGGANAYNGWTLLTTEVPTDADLEIVRGWVLHYYGIPPHAWTDATRLIVSLPMSTSYLKLVGVPFYKHGLTVEHTDSGDVDMAFRQSPLRDFYWPKSRPRIIANREQSRLEVYAGSSELHQRLTISNYAAKTATEQGARVQLRSNTSNFVTRSTTYKRVYAQMHIRVGLSSKPKVEVNARSGPIVCGHMYDRFVRH